MAAAATTTEAGSQIYFWPGRIDNGLHFIRHKRSECSKP